MKNMLTTLSIVACAAAVLPACTSMGWGDKSAGGGGGTHTMTGGAEAAPTSEATPQPARTRGQSETGTQGGMPSETQEGTGGSATPGSESGMSGPDTGAGGAAGAR